VIRLAAPSALALVLTVALTVAAQDGDASANAAYRVSRLDGLTEAPYPPVEGAPQVLAQAPVAIGPEIDVVLHLHGYEGCVEVLAQRGPARCRAGAHPEEGWDLLGAHASAGVTSWLLLPQLAFHRRDGSPGRLAREGSARRLIEESVARVARDRGVATPRVRRVTVTAHSAGFEATIAVMRHGGLGELLQNVVLFDAMYSGVGTFGGWAAEDPRRALVAFHTGTGTPARRARELEQHYRRRLGARLVSGEGADEDDIAPGRVVLLRARTGHRGVPRRYLGPTLARLLSEDAR
jgi:hypothetical protein